MKTLLPKKKPNTNKIDVSIVIPVYNSAEYIEETVRSAFDNHWVSVEVIAVVDGSPDHSIDLLRVLQGEFKNLVVLDHENVGGATTLNRGLRAATGKYVGFLDGDDKLLPGFLDDAFSRCEKDQSDLAVGLVLRWKKTRVWRTFDQSHLHNLERVTSLEKDGMGKSLLFDGMYTGKVFDREFLKSNNIWFNPHRLYADRQFVAKAFACADAISMIDGEVAYWRVSEGENKSITQRQQEPKNFVDRMLCYFETRDVLKSVLPAEASAIAVQNLDVANARRVLWILRKVKYFSDSRLFGDVAHYFLSNISDSWLQEEIAASSAWSASRKTNKLRLISRIPMRRMVWLRFPFVRTQIDKVSKRISPAKIYRPDMIPPDPTIIMFESFFGKEYGGQPRYIYEELLKSDKYFRAVWVCSPLRSEPLDIPGYVVQVKRGSKEYFDYLARAGFWVNNIRFPVQRKPKGTVYLQTWHGTPLKRLGGDIEISSGPEIAARQSAYREARLWDYLLSQNDYSTEKLQRAFRPDCPVLTYGYPAADALKDCAKGNPDLRKKMGIPKNKKVILYAPTWRDKDQIKGKNWEFSFEFPFDVAALMKHLGKDYVLVVRMHHLVSFKLEGELMGRTVFDASNVDDASQVMAFADVLVTDYSSVFFDFAVTGKPILFYIQDQEEYVSQMRGFYLDPDQDLPGPVLRTQAEFFDALKNVDEMQKTNTEKYQRFQEKFLATQDGSSAKRIVDAVFKGMPDKW